MNVSLPSHGFIFMHLSNQGDSQCFTRNEKDPMKWNQSCQMGCFVEIPNSANLLLLRVRLKKILSSNIDSLPHM